jgi:hypothetical protein
LAREILDDELAKSRQPFGRRVAKRVGSLLPKHVLEAMSQQLVGNQVRRGLHAGQVHHVAPHAQGLETPRATQRFELARARNERCPRKTALCGTRRRHRRQGLQRHERAAAYRRFDESGVLEVRIGAHDRVAVRRKLGRELARGRQSKTGRKGTRKDAMHDLIEQLFVERIAVLLIEHDAHASFHRPHLDWTHATGPISIQKGPTPGFLIDQYGPMPNM